MTIDSADDSRISNRTINTNRISNRTYDSKSNRITKLRRSLDWCTFRPFVSSSPGPARFVPNHGAWILAEYARNVEYVQLPLYRVKETHATFHTRSVRYAQCSFAVSGRMSWNSLPSSVRNTSRQHVDRCGYYATHTQNPQRRRTTVSVLASTDHATHTCTVTLSCECYLKTSTSILVTPFSFCTTYSINCSLLCL